MPPHELLAASEARRGDGATNGQVAYAVGNSNGNIEENEKPAQRDAAANGNGKEEAGLQMIGIENVEPVSSFHAMFTLSRSLLACPLVVSHSFGFCVDGLAEAVET